MAFAFPAYHEEIAQLPMPITHDWVIYACNMAGLGPAVWGLAAWRVSPSTSFFSWGENMIITPLAPNVIRVRSECGLPTQCIDWGKNETNVKKLINVLVAGMRQAMPVPPYR